MLDIGFDEQKKDFKLVDSSIYKAKNLLEIQLGDLFYLDDWGIDLEYFFDENILFQNESFIAYIQDRLVKKNIFVEDVSNVVSNFVQKIGITIGEE